MSAIVTDDLDLGGHETVTGVWDRTVSAAEYVRLIVSVRPAHAYQRGDLMTDFNPRFPPPHWALSICLSEQASGGVAGPQHRAAVSGSPMRL